MNKKKIGIFFLAGIMAWSMGTGVYAKEKDTVSVIKNFEMAEGLTVPNVKFQFSATPVTEDAPQITIQDIDYHAFDHGETIDGKITISKKTPIQLPEKFPHAGVYKYTIRETKGEEEGVTYATDVYTLRVYVKNTPNGLEVDRIIAEKGENIGVDANKVGEICFTNTYKKNASLKISKRTEGKYADLTKKFNFNIKIYPSATEAENNTTYIGQIGTKEIEVKSGEQGTPFQLAHNECLVFNNLPVGTKYVVEEVGVEDGYTPKVHVVENGKVTVQNKTESESNSITSLRENHSNNLVGEKVNKVTFTNTYQEIAITGVVVNKLPFIMMFLVAFATLSILVVIKKYTDARR